MGSEAAPTEIKQEHSELLQKGTEIKVLRSNGEQESGWIIDHFDAKTGDAVVKKEEGKNILAKSIPQIELYALNKPIGESKKFPLKQWVELWNSTEQTQFTLNNRKLEIDAEKVISPEEAREFLRREERKAKGGGKAQLRTGESAERIKRLQRRIAFFGGTPGEEGELKFLLEEK